VESSDEVQRLLEEIRNIQRDHLAEYKRVAQRSLELQEQMSRLRYRVVTAAFVLILGLVVILGLIAYIKFR
jgi:hypothetical protein